MNRAILELIILLAVSIGIAVIGNAVNPAGIPYFGQWSPERGLVHAGGPCAPSTVQISDSDALSDYLSGSALFVDARSRDDYDSGHIPGAVSLPLGSVHDAIYDFLDEYPVDKRIITYCSGVDCHDSHDLATALKEYGYTNLVVYSQGISGWKKQGRSLATFDNEEL